MQRFVSLRLTCTVWVYHVGILKRLPHKSVTNVRNMSLQPEMRNSFMILPPFVVPRQVLLLLPLICFPCLTWQQVVDYVTKIKHQSNVGQERTTVLFGEFLVESSSFLRGSWFSS